MRKAKAGRADRNVTARAANVPTADLDVSAISMFELEPGVLLVERRDEAQGRILWIAATALIHEMTVVTRNITDFLTMGVKTKNPWGETHWARLQRPASLALRPSARGEQLVDFCRRASRIHTSGTMGHLVDEEARAAVGLQGGVRAVSRRQAGRSAGGLRVRLSRRRRKDAGPAVGVAVDPRGAPIVVDDLSNTVWRVTPKRAPS